MKTLLQVLPILALACTFSLAQAQTKMAAAPEGKMKSNGIMPEGVMMKGGKMMVMKDGKMSAMTEALTMSDGSKVMTDGTHLMAKGQKMMMKEGQGVLMDGKMMKGGRMPAGKTSKLGKMKAGM